MKDSSADLMLRQALKEVDRKTLLERPTPEFLQVSKMFEQADVAIRPSMLFGVSLALAVAGGFASMILVNLYVVPVGGLIMFMLPWTWLYFKRGKRLKKFGAQLPDAMELVARALRAHGHSLAAGLHHVVAEGNACGPADRQVSFAAVYGSGTEPRHRLGRGFGQYVPSACPTSTYKNSS